MPDFNPEAFDPNYAPPADTGSDATPTVTPNLQTFYYPETPENTSSAGLDYSMEGGIHGSGNFSEVDLRNHTFEKFLSGESPFVAVAMKGQPDGSQFNMNIGGFNVLAKNMDTGGGLRDGQIDVATSDPEKAKRGLTGSVFDPEAFNPARIPQPKVESGTSGQRTFDPQAFMPAAPSELPEPKEEQPRTPIQMPEYSPPPIPQVTTNVPQFIPQQIGGAHALPQQLPIGGIPRPPQPTPSGPPSPPTQGPGPVARTMAMPYIISPQLASAGIDTALGAIGAAYPQTLQAANNLSLIAPQSVPILQGVKQSLANTISGASAPSTLLAAPALAIPGVAEAWGAYQIAQTPKAWANVADVVKRYGLGSKEAATAITGEATRLAMAGTALKGPIKAVSRGITESNLVPQSREIPGVNFGRAGIVRQAQAGAVNIGQIINATRKPNGKLTGYGQEHGDVSSRLSESYDPEQLESGWVRVGRDKAETDASFVGVKDVQETKGDIEAAIAKKSSFGRKGIERAKQAGSVPYSNAPDSLMGYSKEGNYQKGFYENNYKYELPVKITLPDGEVFYDVMNGLNKAHAMERARRNWSGDKVEEASPSEFKPPSQFGRARINRAGQEGAVPQPSETRVLPEGAVKGSGRYAKAGRVNKEAMDNINALAASRESGQLLANTQSLYVMGKLTPESAIKLSGEQFTDLGRYLVSERLKGVNPEHHRVLSDAETKRIESDPKIMAAVERYANKVKPEQEALKLKAGLRASAAEGKSRIFVSLVPTAEELAPESIPPSSGAFSAKSKTTVFARHAEGYAPDYETNLAKILDKVYTEVMPKARMFDTYQSLKKNGLISQESVKEIKGQPAVKTHWVIPGMDDNARLPDFSYVPAQINDAIRDATERVPNISSPLLDALHTYQRGVTGAALTANPLAVGNHMRRQFGVIVRTPPKSIPAEVQVLEGIIPYFGPRVGTAIRAFTRDASTPEFKAIMQKITDANAGSTRAFKQYQATGKIAQATGLSELQQWSHELLFGIPEGEGIKGWDWRLRVQGEIERMAAEPWAIDDPQRVREVANRLGDYTSHPSKLVQTVKAVQPFAATTLPVREAEIRSLFGGSGLQSKTGAAATMMRLQTVLRGTGGTLIALMAANKLLTGHWNWQNKSGNELKLETNLRNAKGDPVTVDLRYIDPGVDRALKTLGIPNLIREKTSGVANPNYVTAGMVGPANALSSILNSPLSAPAWTLATGGTVPYLVKKPGQEVPHFLDVVRKGPTSDRGLNTLLAAIANINPIGELALKYAPDFVNYVEQQPQVKRTSGQMAPATMKGQTMKGSTMRAGTMRPKTVR